MPSANTTPIFPLTPVVTWSTALTTANTALDGTGTVLGIFTAGTNGSRVDQIKVMPLGTNVATVMRVFINNGSTNATAANNVLYRELAIPANTLSQTAVSNDALILTMGLFLPSGYKLNVTIGTTIAAGINVTCEGGNY